jgi:hypothetical protein
MNGYLASILCTQFCIDLGSLVVGENITKSKATEKCRQGEARKGNPKLNYIFQNKKQGLLYTKKGGDTEIRTQDANGRRDPFFLFVFFFLGEGGVVNWGLN